MHEAETPSDSSYSPNGKGHTGLRRAILILAGGLLGAMIFVLDLVMPLGAIAGMPYAILVMLGFLAEGWSFTLTTGAVTTLLTIAGHPLSRAGGDFSADLANRTIALAAIWCAVFLLLHVKRREEANENMLSGTAARIKAHNDTAPGRARRLPATDQLAGTAAHELRNPLGAIVTSISVIEFRARQAELDITAALDRAKRGVARCEKIIDEHLDAARAKGHRPENVEIDDWLATLIEEMPQRPEITLVADLRAPGLVVSIDPEAFRRVLINLIDNAHQALANQPEGGTVIAGTRRLSRGAEIFVADNGPGIPTDLLSRVTEALFSTRPGGTGLGLPTAQRIIDDHGGSMTIESEPGRGTRVILRLPSPNCG